MPAPLAVRAVPEAEHLAFLDAHLAGGGSASFLQTPAWGRVKADWRRESLLWSRDGEDVGAALVLYRQLPRLRRYLAYLPEGPVLADDAWAGGDLGAWLEPLRAHLRSAGAFGVRMGPPVVVRRWSAQQVKDGIADEAVRRLGEVAPSVREPVGARVVGDLRALGWRRQGSDEGFAAGQPPFVFQVPLRGADGTALYEDAVLRAMNQQWRRNIKKAAKSGVEVTSLGGAQVEDALPAFHLLYVHTAQRDHFTPRPLAYFRTMAAALGAEDPDRFRLHLAHHEGDLVAATIAIRVGRHSWYSYGASSTEKRDVRGSNAAQWAMIREALAAGADVYDLRGITDTLDASDDHVGLIQFKVGTGGEAVEYVGEWDLPLNRPLYRAFDLYMRRR